MIFFKNGPTPLFVNFCSFQTQILHRKFCTYASAGFELELLEQKASTLGTCIPPRPRTVADVQCFFYETHRESGKQITDDFCANVGPTFGIENTKNRPKGTVFCTYLETNIALSKDHSIKSLLPERNNCCQESLFSRAHLNMICPRGIYHLLALFVVYYHHFVLDSNKTIDYTTFALKGIVLLLVN